MSSIIGVLLAPLAMFLDRGCSMEFLVTFFLFLCGDFPGMFYYFHVRGVVCCTNLFCILVPPLAVMMHKGCCVEVLIALLLWPLGLVPGIVYAYYLCMPGSAPPLLGQ